MLKGIEWLIRKWSLAGSIGLGSYLIVSCSAQVLSQANSQAPAPIRIMPLGDSITQANKDHNSYRRPLWHKLRQAGYQVDFVGSHQSHFQGGAPQPDFDLDHSGYWGWEIGQVLTHVDQWVQVARPDIVLIHLGSNDVGKGHPLDEAISDMRQLLQRLRQSNPRITLLVAQLIPIHGFESRIQDFNREIAQLAQELNTPESPVIAVDQFSQFNVTPGQDSYDGLHPNLSGEEKIAQRWFTALQKQLPESARSASSQNLKPQNLQK